METYVKVIPGSEACISKARCSDSVNEDLGIWYSVKWTIRCIAHFHVQLHNYLVTPNKLTHGCEGWRGQISWGGVMGTEPTVGNLIWEVRAWGPKWADAGGREPGAVVPPAKCLGKVIPLFGIKHMSIKTKLWTLRFVNVQGVENDIVFLEGRLIA